MRSTIKQRHVIFAGAIAWLLMVGSGLALLWDYSSAPGAPGSAPVQWPASSRIRPVSDRFTLVVVAHPHCPCSRATIGALGVLMARAQGRVNAHVLFVQPAGFDGDWVKTDLWRSAAAIPGVDVLQDEGGIEAHRFGAETSGQTLLYDPMGRLSFSGGITSARGHYGDSAGLDSIVELVASGAGNSSAAPVFGCPLFERGAQCSKGSKPCVG